MSRSDVPHIKVSVELNGQTVSQQGAFFIDAIKFLCDTEAFIRLNCGLPSDCDCVTKSNVLQNWAGLIEAVKKEGGIE